MTGCGQTAGPAGNIIGGESKNGFWGGVLWDVFPLPRAFHPPFPALRVRTFCQTFQTFSRLGEPSTQTARNGILQHAEVSRRHFACLNIAFPVELPQKDDTLQDTPWTHLARRAKETFVAGRGGFASDVHSQEWNKLTRSSLKGACMLIQIGVLQGAYRLSGKDFYKRKLRQRKATLSFRSPSSKPFYWGIKSLYRYRLEGISSFFPAPWSA